MDIKKITVNIFSNWTFFSLLICTSFIVSPILVHSLGDEQYGLWVLIGSILGYFSVMDLGFGTALVRFIPKYDANKDFENSRKVYSNAFILFVSIGILIAVVCAVIAYYFPMFIQVQTIPKKYIFLVFILASLELSTLMGTGMFSGVLHAKQEFLWMNIINIVVLVVKNIILVMLLLNGFRLVTVAMLNLSATGVRSFLRYIYIKRNHRHLVFRSNDFDTGTMKMIFGYSIYSFLIAISLKVLFFTDSIVIGTFLSVSSVTFYAIPMTLFTYLEQITTVGISVLTPTISSNDASGEHDENREIYIWGARYALILSLPVIFVLFTNGDSFIGLWMGEAYGIKSSGILKILCVGYVAYLSQVIAMELLKGISRHKFIAYTFIIEAVANLAISVILIKVYGFGLEGAAYGTTIPLVVVNLFVIPIYVCRVVDLSYPLFIVKNYFPLCAFSLLCGLFYYYIYPFRAVNYLQLSIYSFFVATTYLCFSFFFVINPNHRSKFVFFVKRKLI